MIWDAVYIHRDEQDIGFFFFLEFLRVLDFLKTHTNTVNI